MKKLLLTILFMALSVTSIAKADDEPTYKNIYISYMSHNDVIELNNYADQAKLAGYILWPIQGDTNPNTAPDTSLLAAMKEANKPVMAYWTDWGVYTDKALPVTAYPIPGSIDNTTGQAAENQDLAAKLPFLNSLTYAFMEINVDATKGPVGSVYFFDPWADLLPTDKFCTAKDTAHICTVAVKSGRTFADSAKMGNFEAFANLPAKYPNLKATVSIGGYGGKGDRVDVNDAFKTLFSNPTYEDNFVNSIAAVVSHYKLAGVDLDYEDPQMTPAQSQQYLALIQKLSAKMPTDTTITITMLSNPEYLNGTEASNTIGFSQGVLKSIADLPNVKTINAMTYDNHGAFDFKVTNNKITDGYTGFMSNIYLPSDSPAQANNIFSDKSTVAALTGQGVAASKIDVGVPAYGRALINIKPANGGLYQQVLDPTDLTILPKGDLDAANCKDTIPGATCSGTFTYSYILNHMVKDTANFPATDHKNGENATYNGTTAYATSWSPSGPSPTSSHSLEVTNTGATAGTNLAFNMILTDATGATLALPDYFNLGTKKTYDAKSLPALASFDDKKGIKISMKWYGGTSTCSDASKGTFDFTANKHIMVKLTMKDQKISDVDCDIETVSGK